MQKVIFALSILITGCIAFSGCKDKCNDKPCFEGEVVDCKCECTAGFEGSYCVRWWTKKFTSNYTVTITCPADTSDPEHGRTYAGRLADRGPHNPRELTIENIAGSATHGTALLSDSLSFTVPVQPDIQDPTIMYSGSGSLSPDFETAVFNYTITNASGTVKQCVATFVRDEVVLPIIVD